MFSVFDNVWNESTVTGLEIGGAILISIGFVLLVFGDVLTWSHVKAESISIKRNIALGWKNMSKTKNDKAEISTTNPTSAMDDRVPHTEMGVLSSILQSRHNSASQSDVPMVKAGNFRHLRNVSRVGP